MGLFYHRRQTQAPATRTPRASPFLHVPLPAVGARGPAGLPPSPLRLQRVLPSERHAWVAQAGMEDGDGG